MNQKTYYLTAGTLFLIIGIVHLLRVLNGWPTNVSAFVVPMWFSWVAVFIAGYMAYHGLKKRA